MIDVAPEINTRVANALRAAFPNIDVSDDYIKAPSRFPHVSVTEEDNIDVPQFTTDSKQMVRLVFNVNVYSNKARGKKTEARKIMAVVDDVMHSMNALRTFMHPIPNMQNHTIYRLTAQYALSTDGKYFYRRQS